MKTFLEFIETDIEAKNTLITSLPLKTKTNKKKYSEKLEEITNKYLEYQTQLKKYLQAKSAKFESKRENKTFEKELEELKKLENIRFALNPRNTYYEKMCFDNLIYELSNYTDFKFKELNVILKNLISKLGEADVYLTKEDFKYTFYVYEYMGIFLEEMKKEKMNRDLLNKTFEKIYWLNPEIVKHIEISFRKIIKQNEKKLTEYTEGRAESLKVSEGIKTYQDCLDRLKIAYNNFKTKEEENIWDIVDLIKVGEIDVNMFFDDSKQKTTAFSTLTIEPIKPEEEKKLNKFYFTIAKLRSNLIEYKNYSEFKPLIDNFIKEYEPVLQKRNEKKADSLYINNIKKLDKEINEKENNLLKITKKILEKSILESNSKIAIEIKELKIDSNKIASNVYDLYKEKDKEEFNLKVFNMINKALTVSELMNFYYSHDYFKKQKLKSITEVENYNQLVDLSDKFDLFAMNPTNIITKGSLVFDPIELDAVIVNKYRLDNINLTVEALDEAEIDTILDKINLLLRSKLISESELTTEILWFISEVNKINIVKN